MGPASTAHLTSLFLLLIAVCGLGHLAAGWEDELLICVYDYGVIPALDVVMVHVDDEQVQECCKRDSPLDYSSRARQHPHTVVTTTTRSFPCFCIFVILRGLRQYISATVTLVMCVQRSCY